MKIGVGLPATVPGAEGKLVLDWAKKADEGPFSSLGIIDRLVYPNHESMITLAAAAGVTTRVRLMTSVLIGPVRNAAILAKEAATLDSLSGGRLTLGLGVGGRQDDFDAVAAEFKGRGQKFEEQLELMKRIWSSELVSDDIGPIGPPPVQSGGPELLIGAINPKAIQRVGRWADGFIAPGTPESVSQGYAVAEESWKEAGRPGKPRLVGAAYYSLGSDAQSSGEAYIRDYYSFMGPAVDFMAQSILSTPEAITDTLQGFSAIGTDEFILWPTVADIGQLDRLAELVGGL